MMSGKHGIQTVGIALASFVAVGCSEPKLRSELEPDSDAASEETGVSVAPDSIEAKREAVIGRTFESLTLGDRRFRNAEIREITDGEIVVAHAGGVDRVPWTEVPEEVQQQWGYAPGRTSMKDRLVDALPGISNKPGENVEKAEKSEQPAEEEPVPNLAERAREIAMKEQMLKAQLAGIQTLESDLSRHTISLNSLRAELQAVRAMQSNQRSGGIRVERIGGESTLVDRKKQAREIEAKLKVEEQLVAQLSQSLQKARQQYQALNAELIQLRQ